MTEFSAAAIRLGVIVSVSVGIGVGVLSWAGVAPWS